MAVNVQYDRVEWVEVGYAAASHIEIDNVVSWADRVVSPDGDMVYPMQFVNLSSPPGVHHNHKYWEMEMVLDTDYLTDDTNPVNYWAHGPAGVDVDALAGLQFAIQCGVNPPTIQNHNIEWLKAFIREGDGSQTQLTYAVTDANTVWCTGETASFNNEEGERHQTTTFKFICLGERGKTHSAAGTWTHNPGNAGYANEAPVKHMRVDNFTVANACTNVLRFEDDFTMQMTPQFMPNTFQGLDMKQDQRWRILTVIVDSETDIFDTYIDIITANTPLPVDFFVEFTLADGLSTTERWTYSAGTGLSYILSRREGEIHSDVPRDTIEYRILTPCNKTITHP